MRGWPSGGLSSRRVACGYAEECSEEEVQSANFVAVKDAPYAEADKDTNAYGVNPHTIGVGNEGGFGGFVLRHCFSPLGRK